MQSSLRSIGFVIPGGNLSISWEYLSTEMIPLRLKNFWLTTVLINQSPNVLQYFFI